MSRGKKSLQCWLEDLMNRSSIGGLRWIDRNRRVFRVPWMHQSRKDWNRAANEVATQWGKYRAHGSVSPKRAKATLRMAFNSLKKRGKIISGDDCSKLYDDPHKVFQFKSSSIRVRYTSDASSVTSGDTSDDDVLSPMKVESDDEDDSDMDIPTIVAEAASRPAILASSYRGRKTIIFPKEETVKRVTVSRKMKVKKLTKKKSTIPNQNQRNIDLKEPEFGIDLDGFSKDGFSDSGNSSDLNCCSRLPSSSTEFGINLEGFSKDAYSDSGNSSDSSYKAEVFILDAACIEDLILLPDDMDELCDVVYPLMEQEVVVENHEEFDISVCYANGQCRDYPIHNTLIEDLVNEEFELKYEDL